MPAEQFYKNLNLARAEIPRVKRIDRAMDEILDNVKRSFESDQFGGVFQTGTTTLAVGDHQKLYPFIVLGHNFIMSTFSAAFMPACIDVHRMTTYKFPHEDGSPEYTFVASWSVDNAGDIKLGNNVTLIYDDFAFAVQEAVVKHLQAMK